MNDIRKTALTLALGKTAHHRNGCRVWSAGVTGSGAPRQQVGSGSVDARRLVLEALGETHPTHVRFANRCDSGAPCLNSDCITLAGELDMLALSCPKCGKDIRVLRSIHAGSYCSGAVKGTGHRATRMLVAKVDAL